MARRMGVGLVMAALALTAAPLQAQTPGIIPVWVDSQTLGDSPLVQCGDGTSVCIGPGSSPAIGPSTLIGFTNATQINASAVYGEATALTGVTNGVVGLNQSGDNGATGVFGWAVNSNAPGLTTGVWGRSSALDGRGVVGEGQFGVFGIGGGRGVVGIGILTGVLGIGTNGGVGVEGRASNLNSDYAGEFNGRVILRNLAGGGITNPLCLNNVQVIAFCSSSLRYKTELRPFRGGLDIVKRLRPITFTWREGGAHDVGLAAEDVEQVEPLLTFRNDKGEIEGVKYGQLSAVFVNAIVEQQAQIQQQRNEINALKALVCGSHPDADACR